MGGVCTQSEFSVPGRRGYADSDTAQGIGHIFLVAASLYVRDGLACADAL